MNTTSKTPFLTKCAFYASALTLLATPSAFAQSLPDAAQNAIAGQASPGRIQGDLKQRDLSPSLAPKIEIKDIVLQEMPENADKIKFTLEKMIVQDNTVYSEDELKTFYADKIGTTITLKDVYAISTALTNKYRNDGYILTRVIVPPQTIENGIVELRVVEGYVDQISVIGGEIRDNQAAALKQIQAYADHVRSNGPLNIGDLEKFLLLIGDLPGIEARSILSPSPTQVGASDLQIIVQRKTYDAYLGYDNYGSRYLGPSEVTLAGSLNSLLGYNERFSMQTVATLDSGLGKELSYIALGYDQPLGSAGTTLKTLYSHTKTNPGYTLDQYDVKGRADFASLTVQHPVIRSRTENLYLNSTLDWRDVISTNNLEPARHDVITALRLGGQYELLDNLLSVGINSISLEISKGLGILGTTSRGSTNKSRSNGDPLFTKANLDVQRLQRLAPKVNLLMAAHGQIADAPLLTSEEFGVGGINLGRGYAPSEIVGDNGLAGKIELQWNQPYALGANNYIEDYQLYGFYDVGKVWNKDENTSSAKIDSLASAGLGVRANFKNNLNGGVGVAFPLTRDVETRGDRQPMAYININKSF